jgi:hypothetical protein
MIRKKWTVFIGDMGSDRNDAHSEVEFTNRTECNVFLWAKANCEYPEACWVWAGMDGWDSNHHLVGKPFPANLADKIQDQINQEDLLDAAVRGIPLAVMVRPTTNGNFSAYCRDMRCELIIKDISELDSLAAEYAGIVEADYGIDKVNVKLEITYGPTINLAEERP